MNSGFKSQCVPSYRLFTDEQVEELPKGFTSRDFCFKVLDAANVWMIPGSMYGKYGEGYLRIALTHPADRLADAMNRLKEFMIKVK